MSYSESHTIYMVTATHCNTLQHTAPCLPANHIQSTDSLQHTATHCNTLQHTATHCNTLQHSATHCNTLQHSATHCNTLQYTVTRCTMSCSESHTIYRLTATHCNTLQHTATHCNTLHHVLQRITYNLQTRAGQKLDRNDKEENQCSVLQCRAVCCSFLQ